jgi:hypothetical protein
VERIVALVTQRDTYKLLLPRLKWKQEEFGGLGSLGSVRICLPYL